MGNVSRRGFIAAGGAVVSAAGALALAGCSQDKDAAVGAGSSRTDQTLYDPVSSEANDVATSAADPAADAEAEASTATILMVGDVLVHTSVRTSGENADGTRNYDHLFAHVAEDVAAADLAMFDQETILGGEALGFSNYPIFNGPQELIDAEVAAGFDLCLHANNHVVDKGFAGIESELAYWRAHYPDALVTGMADSEEAAAVVPVVELAGHKVAVLNYTENTNGIPLPTDAPWCVRMLTESQVTADFDAARAAGAEAFIVCPHWGIEYAASPSDDQRAWAARFAELGATAIFGNHPHVMQPYELVTASDGRGVPTFWSTGNFVSGQDRKASMVGGMVRVTLSFDGGEVRVAEARLTPLVINKAGATGLTTYKLADYTEELAAGNGIRNDSNCEDFSRQWCVDFCSERLGAGFDPTTCEFYGAIE